MADDITRQQPTGPPNATSTGAPATPRQAPPQGSDPEASMSDGESSELRARAERLARQAREAGRRELEHRKHQVAAGIGKQVEGQKRRARSEVATIAGALRTMCDSLERDEHPRLAAYVRRGAAGVDRLAERIDRQDLAALARQARALAERRPAVFLAASFVAGVAVGRILGTTARRRDEELGSGGREVTPDLAGVAASVDDGPYPTSAVYGTPAGGRSVPAEPTVSPTSGGRTDPGEPGT